ncbi:NADP-dependent oxidoreductase [Streptomyces sp. NPDC002004]
MRAAVVPGFGGPEMVEVVETGLPEPGAGQVRIRVTAAGLNPVDAAVRAGVFGGAGKRLGLGWDVAGVVDATGAATGWSAGDRVIGLAYGPAKTTGTHAEYVVLDASALAAAPASVDDVHAATLPLNGLTAVQALELLELKPGRSLLVTGAAGGVGAYAVQLAARRGVEVVALAGEGDEEFVRGLGAARFVSRQAGARGAAGVEPRSVDAVLDTAVLGAEALGAVRDGGVYVGVQPGRQPASERGVRSDAVEVRADGERLAALAALVDSGELTLRVAETFGLDEAVKAHARLAEGGLRGRVVLVP